MKNSIKGFLFKLPAILLLIVAFIASLIIKINEGLRIQYGVPEISWGAPIILFIIIVLYFIGEYVANLRHSVYAI